MNIGDMERPPGRRVYQDIADDILSQIRTGQLRPGEMLPSERQLAARMHVSRTAVREALHTLGSLGYVESRVGDGTFVREITLDNILKPFSSLLAQDRKMIRDVLDVRILLEAETVRRAAAKASDEDISSMERLIDEMHAQIESGQDGSSADAVFHQRLADTAGNEAISRILSMCSDLIFSSTRFSVNQPGRAEEAVQDHRRIVECLRKHDADGAVAELKDHLRKGYDLLEREG